MLILSFLILSIPNTVLCSSSSLGSEIQIGLGPYLDFGTPFTFNDDIDFKFIDENGSIQSAYSGDYDGYEYRTDIKTGNSFSYGGGVTFSALISVGIDSAGYKYNFFKNKYLFKQAYNPIFGIGFCSDIQYLNSNIGSILAFRYGGQLGFGRFWLKFYVGEAYLSDSLEFVEYYTKDDSSKTFTGVTAKEKNDLSSSAGYCRSFPPLPDIALYIPTNNKDSLLVETGINVISSDTYDGYYARLNVKIGYIYNFVNWLF